MFAALLVAGSVSAEATQALTNSMTGTTVTTVMDNWTSADDLTGPVDSNLPRRPQSFLSNSTDRHMPSER